MDTLLYVATIPFVARVVTGGAAETVYEPSFQGTFNAITAWTTKPHIATYS